MKIYGDTSPPLEGIPEIEAYLRGISFRRRLLGCDPEEVHKSIAELARRYKAIIAPLLSLQGQEWRIQDLQEKLDQLSRENAALHNGLREWSQWYGQANAALMEENERLRRENAALHAERMQSGWACSATR